MGNFIRSLGALRVVSSWPEAINNHEHANNVDKFDKEKQTDLFALLPAVDQARPQVCFCRFFHKVFRSLNAFTVTIDELFDRVLQQPFASPSVYAKAFEYYNNIETSEVERSIAMRSGAADWVCLSQEEGPEKPEEVVALFHLSRDFALKLLPLQAVKCLEAVVQKQPPYLPHVEAEARAQGNLLCI